MPAYEAPLRKLFASWRPVDLARALGVVPSTVTNWRRIPAERVPDVSRITGISRHELRPDLWEPPHKRTRAQAPEGQEEA